LPNTSNYRSRLLNYRRKMTKLTYKINAQINLVLRPLLTEYWVP
jgi:hypothetical protein